MGNASIGAEGGRSRVLRNRDRPARRDRPRVSKDHPKDAAPGHQSGDATGAEPVALTAITPFSELLDEWLRDPAFRSEYDRIGPRIELAFALSEARRDAKLTQAEVARLMGTSQAAVARLESGVVSPSWNSIERYARAVGRRAVVTLVARE
jgi:DNA-binding XRE family transcriptional regulator